MGERMCPASQLITSSTCLRMLSHPAHPTWPWLFHQEFLCEELRQKMINILLARQQPLCLLPVCGLSTDAHCEQQETKHAANRR